MRLIIQKDGKELLMCGQLSFIFSLKKLCICALSRTRMFDQVLLK